MWRGNRTKGNGVVRKMSKMSIQIILKNGAGFTVKCDSFTLKRNGLNQVTGYDIKGITENQPVYLDFEQVAAIVRTLSDEIEAPAEEPMPESR